MRRIYLLLITCLLTSIPYTMNAGSYKVNVSDKLNVREAPSKSASVISVLSNEDVVTSTSETLKLHNNDGIEWAEILLADGRKGYVAASYLTPYDVKETVKEEQSSWVQRFLDWFENLISLKWCFIIILILAYLNFSISTLDDDEFGDTSYIVKPFFYILMNLMLVLTFYSHGLKPLVNHHWTGGWLDGYLMVFINAVLLACVVVVEYRCFVDMSWSLAYQFIPSRKWRKFKPERLFWMFPLLVVAVIIPAIAPVWLIWFLYLIIQQSILFHPRYDIALLVLFFSIFAAISCTVLVYTFFLSLLIGILIIGFLKEAPNTSGTTVSKNTSDVPSEDNTENEEHKRGHLSWDCESIVNDDGTSTRITSVNNDGTVGTADGGEHDVDYWENTKQR